LWQNTAVQFDQAWSHIGEAITAVETTKETWYEAEVHRTTGEIAVMSPERDAAKAEACFERALAVARAQQAKSWELRAAMSMARLWRDQGKRMRPEKFSLRSTAGSPKASILWT
jgi:predicted ATPase